METIPQQVVLLVGADQILLGAFTAVPVERIGDADLVIGVKFLARARNGSLLCFSNAGLASLPPDCIQRRASVSVSTRLGIWLGPTYSKRCSTARHATTVICDRVTPNI